jgi:hypothetical protein
LDSRLALMRELGWRTQQGAGRAEAAALATQGRVAW